jgi:hypothetical protein
MAALGRRNIVTRRIAQPDHSHRIGADFNQRATHAVQQFAFAGGAQHRAVACAERTQCATHPFQLAHALLQLSVEQTYPFLGALALGDVGAQHVVAGHVAAFVLPRHVVDHLPDARKGFPVVVLRLALQDLLDQRRGDGVARLAKHLAHRATGDVRVMRRKALAVVTVHIHVALLRIDVGDQRRHTADDGAQMSLARAQLSPYQSVGRTEQRKQKHQHGSAGADQQVARVSLRDVAADQQPPLFVVHLAQDAIDALARLAQRRYGHEGVGGVQSFAPAQRFDPAREAQALVDHRAQLRPARALRRIVGGERAHAAQLYLAAGDRPVALGQPRWIAGQSEVLRAEFHLQGLDAYARQAVQHIMRVCHAQRGRVGVVGDLPGHCRHAGNDQHGQRERGKDPPLEP